ncbi:hypothetical protein R6Z02_06155 [Carnobacterium maltaromaticum]|nr:hypothetical protein [Carnobacterium maltaromaticum]
MKNFMKKIVDLNTLVDIPIEYKNIMSSSSKFIENKKSILRTTPKSLIHTSLVEKPRKSASRLEEYMSFFFNDMSKDFYIKNNSLFLNTDIKGDSENVRKFSELWGCACGIEVQLQMSHLSGMSVEKIIKSGKRLDYQVIIGSEKIGIEVKGRSSLKNFNRVVSDIKNKKGHSNFDAMFGFVTLTSRDEENVRVIVVDPPNRISDADRRDKVISMLNHYSIISELSGFTLLSKELETRISKIKQNSDEFLALDQKEINYGNVKKIGISYIYNVKEKTNFICHRFNGELGSNRFGMSNEIFELLHEQDFTKLLKYKEDTSLSELSNISVHRDGTIMVFGNSKIG